MIESAFICSNLNEKVATPAILGRTLKMLTLLLFLNMLNISRVLNIFFFSAGYEDKI
jgi:hypothetical protein